MRAPPPGGARRRARGATPGPAPLAAKLAALKKGAATDFLCGAAPKYNGWKPGEAGDGGKTGGGKKPSEMSYSELADYLAANPDAKLDE